MTGNSLLRRASLAGLAVLAAVSANPAAAKDKTIAGTIRGFECGDNCYLTVVTRAGREETGLCAAPECAPWNETTEMPAKLKGRRVVVTVGQGTQVDGEGNVMGEMMSFTKIRFVK